MIPIIAGLALGALMGGGIAALQKKDILQGALMGGIGGAVGGAFMPAAGAVGGVAEGAAAGATGGGGFLGGAGEIAAGAAGTGGGSLGAVAPAAVTPGVGASTGMFGGGIGNFLSANQYPLMGGALGGMMAPGKEPDPADQGNIYTTSFSQEKNPLFGQPGQDYFSSQTYGPGTYAKAKDYNPTSAANGGIIALADGGDVDRYTRPVRNVDPAVTAYNAQLMERANQQYNVNPRPGPNQVPGSVGYIAPPAPKAPVASTSSSENSVSGLTFNPVTQQYEGEFAAPGSKKDSGMLSDGIYRDRYYDPGNSGGGPDGGNASGGNADGGPGAGSDAGGVFANGGFIGYNQGGISSLGSYSDGGQLLRGPGDGVSDDIPAQIGNRQPARLADGEFVVPARIVSELGNGSTDAGAKRLYAMMDRVQKGRKKSIGKEKVAVDSKAHKMLPA